MIAGGLLEYIDETHTYVYDGVILPSITQILKNKFGNKYENVPQQVLNNAAKKGTDVHKVIEEYEKKKIDNLNCEELRNYKFLKKQFNFECLDNEVPIVLFINRKPICAGRIDLILKEQNNIGIGDIKRTYAFDKEYVTYQTNLYRIGYQQCYDKKISFLKGVHLRDKKRKYIDIPIKEEMALELVKNYLKERNNKDE